MQAEKYPAHDKKHFYKYMSTETAFLVLRNRNFKYSSPILFNDPFDIQTELLFDFDKELFPELVFEEICAPLTAWIDSEYMNGGLSGNAADMEAIQEFSQKADDIVHMLRHNTRPLYPEHISIFNNAWSSFQRSIARRLHIRTSTNNLKYVG